MESVKSGSTPTSQTAATGSSTGPSDAETQVGSYVLEFLSSTCGTRLHNLAIMFRNDFLSLWYFDASGNVSACTTKEDGEDGEKISLIHDFELVAAIFVALSYCTPDQLGSMPQDTIKPPAAAPYPASFPPESLKGFTIDLAAEQEQTVLATLIRHLYTQYTLIGRRTIVYVAYAPGLYPGSDEIVIKISQQYVGRKSEADILELAHARKVKHVAELIKAKDLFRLSDGIRNLFGVEFDDRVARAIAMPLYATLSSTLDRDPLLLKKMARQMIQCESALPYLFSLSLTIYYYRHPRPQGTGEHLTSRYQRRQHLVSKTGGR